MAVLDTGDLTIPDQILDPWLKKVQGGSVVAALSQAIPQKFGTGKAMVFDIGEAELVQEGANKGPSTVTKEVQTLKPHKLHKTVRWTDEVMFADEDHQLGVVSQILSLIQPALSRGLDFIALHGIDPATGAAASPAIKSLSDTTNVVTLGSDPVYKYIDAADKLVLANGYVPSDLAMSPGLAAKFSSLRTSEGVKVYPDLSLSVEVSNLDGHRTSVSRTVSAQGVAVPDTGIAGFVGDFSTVGWGVQRSIGLKLIEYGDPDGQGDLQRNNQVAFRAEVIYGIGIADLDAVARIDDPADVSS